MLYSTPLYSTPLYSTLLYYNVLYYMLSMLCYTTLYYTYLIFNICLLIMLIVQVMIRMDNCVDKATLPNNVYSNSPNRGTKLTEVDEANDETQNSCSCWLVNLCRILDSVSTNSRPEWWIIYHALGFSLAIWERGMPVGKNGFQKAYCPRSGLLWCQFLCLNSLWDSIGPLQDLVTWPTHP